MNELALAPILRGQIPPHLMPITGRGMAILDKALEAMQAADAMAKVGPYVCTVEYAPQRLAGELADMLREVGL